MREEPLSRFHKCLQYCRAVATFIFSHIGLCSLVVGYTIVGAFAFEALEAEFERNKKIELMNARNAVIDSLWEITENQVVLYQSNWTPVVAEKLRDFEKSLVVAVRKMGYDGTDEDEIQWTFSGALLYSIIVITTIGYGNVAPKTPSGKVVTILYAVIGIPLMLLCMSNIGDTMARSFKFVYWKVCCYFCTRSKKSRRARSVRYHRYPSMRVRPGSGRSPSSQQSSTRSKIGDDMSGGSSFYGNADDLALDKYADEEVASYTAHHRHRLPIQVQPTGRSSSPEQTGRGLDANKVPIILNKYVLESKEDLRVDLPPSHHKENYVNNLQAPPSGSGGVPGESSPRHPHSPRPPHRPTTLVGPMQRHSNRRRNFRYQEELEYADSLEEAMEAAEQEEADLDKANVTVPIWLCCTLVTGYICGGAVLFSFWEGWDFLDSSYFCFVTLTTIGFGDLVPGKTVIHDDSQTTLALCALYLLFGMALLAMSFNLVQEQVTTTVKTIGKQIGIIEDDDDDEE